MLVLLSSWHGGETLRSVKVDGAHHRSVLRDALSHLLGWYLRKRRENYHKYWKSKSLGRILRMPSMRGDNMRELIIP